MSVFFRGSQTSECENTAFFQNGQASKVSIFDNPPPSESQLAYELFNSQQAQPPPNDRSLISQLELLDRREDFAQTPLPAPRPPSKREQVESQESKDSRMTFGGKVYNKLRESLAEEPPKFYEERQQPSKPKVTAAGGRPKPSQPSSSFSLMRQCPVVKEPDSMPVKFQGSKGIGKIVYEAPSNSSSSFSIDFQEIKQRNQMEIKPLAKQITSLKLNNQREQGGGRSESGRSEKVSDNFSNGSKEMEQKEKKFGFNLRKSKVSEDIRDGSRDTNRDTKPVQNNFSLKNISPITANPQTITNNLSISPNIQVKPEAKTTKEDEKAGCADDTLITPFKLKPKQPAEKAFATSIVKKVEPEQKTNLFTRNTEQQRYEGKAVQEPRGEKEIKRYADNRVTEPKMNIEDTMERQPSESSKRRQSIGLKEQLKKLTGRPTEKVQLKSIAFNKSFKLKPKPVEQPPIKPEEPYYTKENGSNTPTGTSSGFTIQKSSQNDHRPPSRAFMGMKEERNELPTPKQTKSSDFSKYMLALMEIQQESESLKAKTERSRNFYREIAILNNDLNRRIDLVLRDPKR